MAEQENHDGRSSIHRINEELTIGDDIEFETLWWRIERGLWLFLSIVLLLALSGLLGNGPLAHHEIDTPDQALEVRYERVAHYKSPAILQVRIRPQLFQNGRAYLWINRVIVNDMGEQRIIPQPEQSSPGDNGILYVFPVEDVTRPLIVSFALEPSKVGIFRQEVRVDPRHDLFPRSTILP